MDVLVIGGGVVGVSCALELAQRGAAVTVLERDRVGHGCSFGNAGWLTPSQATPLANPSMVFKSFRWMLDPESPLYIQPRLDAGYLRWLLEFLLASRQSKFEPGVMALVQLCNASVDMWEALSVRSSAFSSFERRGLLAVYEHEASFASAAKSNELMARAGVRVERWTADEQSGIDTMIVLPPDAASARWQDVVTRQRRASSSGRMKLADLLADLPVAVLCDGPAQ